MGVRKYIDHSGEFGGVGEFGGTGKGTVLCEIRMRPQSREDAAVFRGRFV